MTVPLPGYDNKRIYVWFEAVIGYLSAAVEWAQRQGRPGRVAGVLAGPGLQILLLHGQGQHRLPHDHLAGHADGLRGLRRRGRAGGLQPAVRRAGQRVRDAAGPQDIDVAELGGLGAGLPGAPRSGPASVLLLGEHARVGGRELLLGRVRAAQQRRAGGDLRQPGPPGIDAAAPLLRWAGTGPRGPGRYRQHASGARGGDAASGGRQPVRLSLPGGHRAGHGPGRGRQSATWTGRRHGARPRKHRRWPPPPCGRPSAPSPPSRPFWPPSYPSAAATLHTMGGFPGLLEEAGWTTQRPGAGAGAGARCAALRQGGTTEWWRRRRSASSR